MNNQFYFNDLLARERRRENVIFTEARRYHGRFQIYRTRLENQDSRLEQMEDSSSQVPVLPDDASGQTLLVTGGGGYIGSHVVMELLLHKYDLVVIDSSENCVKGHRDIPVSLLRLKHYTSRDFAYIELDLNDKDRLAKVFREFRIVACLHFAVDKRIHLSLEDPLQCFKNNVGGTTNLLEMLSLCRVKYFLYCGTDMVYKAHSQTPVTEQHPVGMALPNPVAKSCFIIEQLLHDWHKADPTRNVVILRCSTPLGADRRGIVGEHGTTIRSSLMNNIMEFVKGNTDRVFIRGNGSMTSNLCRDFVHVVDLAKLHVKALEKCFSKCGWKIYNAGSGKVCTEMEIVNEMRRQCRLNQHIPMEFVMLRPLEARTLRLDCSRAKGELQWDPSVTIRDMCSDTVDFLVANPAGYDSREGDTLPAKPPNAGISARHMCIR